jgi:hypothetical protein
MRRVLRSACLAVAATGVALTMSLPAAEAHARARALSAVSTRYGALDSVYCTTKANCWAVGQRHAGKAYLNEIIHWNGTSWRQAVVPNPGGTTATSDNGLDSVRCVSSADCWAVGDYSKGGAYFAEALRWNGKHWRTTTVPDPAGTGTGHSTQLSDSTCTAANRCWAVGDVSVYSVVNGEKEQNLVLHWNGSRWSQSRVPNPGGTKLTDLNSLQAVRCISAADCNAVGSYGSSSNAGDVDLNETLHWNGKSWSWVHAPNPGGTGPGVQNELGALACGGPADCWGGGFYTTITPAYALRNEMLHWNGATWTEVKVPNPGAKGARAVNYVFGATCDGPADCWAVGEYESRNGATLNQALHWNGKRWYLVGTPNPAGTTSRAENYIYAVRCTSSANCWAVGASVPPAVREFENEILHWNGKKWSSWKL